MNSTDLHTPDTIEEQAALDQAEAEAALIAADAERLNAETRHDCDGCRGDGVWYGAGAVVNGVFQGRTGKCFRCGGKGYQSDADVKRNRFYDNRVRRYEVGR